MNKGSQTTIFGGLTRNIFLLGLVSLLTDVSSQMVFPLIPLFLTTVLGAGASVVGVVALLAGVLINDEFRCFPDHHRLTQRIKHFDRWEALGWSKPDMCIGSTGFVAFLPFGDVGIEIIFVEFSATPQLTDAIEFDEENF